MPASLNQLSFDIASLQAAYQSGTSVREVIAEARRRCAIDNHNAFIHRLTEHELEPFLARLDGVDPHSLPLYGVPFAIKDNIDLAGIPTTAGCPEFAYTPEANAFLIQRFIDAGAIPMGKANLDQFATGLNGTRSPFGACRNAFHPDFISGGSSSGSAVSVAKGWVTFSLGTDTAGSGRVPASFNNLVGLKPTKGWFSTRGVVPACRSLDCVSVFGLTIRDASAVADIIGHYDEADPFARVARPDPLSTSDFRFGIPRADQLNWFGDTLNAPLFEIALQRLEAAGGTRVEIDFAPFAAAARLLYEGPWVAERWSAIRTFHAEHADAIFPVTRQIIEGGAQLLAVDAFEAQYRLAALRRQADSTWSHIDTLVLPTAASIYTQAQLAAEPIKLNSILGTYTNFANLLDTAALAVPVGLREDGLPFGVTLFGPAWSDARLAALASPLHRAAALPLGATGCHLSTHVRDPA